MQIRFFIFLSLLLCLSLSLSPYNLLMHFLALYAAVSEGGAGKRERERERGREIKERCGGLMNERTPPSLVNE